MHLRNALWRRIIPVLRVGRGLQGFAGWGGEGSPRVSVSGAVQVTAVQRDALRAPPIGATVQLRYTLHIDKRQVNNNKNDLKKNKTMYWGVCLYVQGKTTHPLLLLHQFGRKVLMELFLLHVRRFNLHPILQHVDVVGLSVNCRKQRDHWQMYRNVVDFLLGGDQVAAPTCLNDLKCWG